jgi:hypothetical protein
MVDRDHNLTSHDGFNVNESSEAVEEFEKSKESISNSN